MFSYDTLNLFYTFLGYSSTPFLIAMLLVAWRNINCRYILLVLLSIELLESLAYETTYSWRNEYYLWGVFTGLLSIIPVLGRRLIALRLKKIPFFHTIANEYRFLKQEGAIIFCYALSTLIHAITYIEVSLYTNRIIENYIFQKHIFSPAIAIIHITCYVLIFGIAVKNRTIDNFKLDKAS
ncbi:hypothetical protein J8M20_07970 [Pseudoalteromonas luteoviolacea]|uniref:hypothetical protein n=1 Tax=Pseudoalteromonas luteoviolacea TaxID=43657 RepID=UPI001B39567E|nr:hypothetical protein [Pseudoalteromonas luteoviolacea]MBQ4811269.1 hypothetical protein [Pseudoalteromonas luteoviolacea]